MGTFSAIWQPEQGADRRKPRTEPRAGRPTMIWTGKRCSQDGLKFRLAGEENPDGIDTGFR
jgi:hypothetical protein